MLVCICGQQNLPEDIGDEPDEAIEFLTSGTYYEKKDSIYILYEQVEEDGLEVTKNRIKVTDDCIEVTKTGSVSTHMIFDLKHRTDSVYDTPFGRMILGINTSRIDIVKEEDLLGVIIGYELNINSQTILETELAIKVISKKPA